MNLIKKWFFRIDLTRDVKVPFMQLIKGDLNTQSFVVTLLNNGDIVEVNDTDIITLNIDKPDGTKNVISGKIDGDGVVSFILDSQALAVIGICTCNIRIVKDGQIVTSLGFNYKVIDDPYSDTDSSVESVNDYPVLSELLIRINAVLEKANGLNTFYETNLPIFNDLVSNSQILLDIAKNKDEAKALIDSATLLKNEISAIALQIGNINELKIELNTKLSMLNSKLSEFTQMYKDIDLLIKKAIESEKNLQIQLNRYDSAKPSIDELYSKIEEAKLLLSQLKGILPTATSKIEELANNIKKATDVNLLLVNNTESANNTNSILLGTKSSADIINDELTSSITLGQNTKTNLDNSTTVAKEVNVNLDKSVSTANATDNKLNATNTTAVATTTTLNKTINTANNSYGNLQKAIDGTDLTNYALKMNVPNRNLLLNSNKEIKTADYLFPQIYLVEKPVVGETYTLTIQGQIGSGKSFVVNNSGAYIGLGTLAEVTQGVYSKTFTWKDTATGSDGNVRTANNTYLQIHNYPPTINAVSLINKIKLEKGSIRTEWVPAYEDFAPHTHTELATKNDLKIDPVAYSASTLRTPQQYLDTMPNASTLEYFSVSVLGSLPTVACINGSFALVNTVVPFSNLNSLPIQIAFGGKSIAIRQAVDGDNWGNWNLMVLTTDIYKFTEIPINADLNAYKTSGLYACTVAANVKTLLNCPISEAFILKVSTTTNGKTIQELITLSSNFEYKRTAYTTFTNWNLVLNSSLGNKPYGYAGLDANGKISESVLPQSILDRITALENKLQG